jgi:hypothetical protein
MGAEVINLGDPEPSPWYSCGTRLHRCYPMSEMLGICMSTFVFHGCCLHVAYGRGCERVDI